METATASDVKVLFRGADVDFDGSVFRWEVDGQWSTHEVCATPEIMRRLIFSSGIDEKEFIDFLNDKISEYESTCVLGTIIDRKVVIRQGYSITGGSEFIQHRALVKLESDWWDDSTNPPKIRMSGENVWVDTKSPSERV